jgi:hypothetical protein
MIKTAYDAGGYKAYRHRVGNETLKPEILKPMSSTPDEQEN